MDKAPGTVSDLSSVPRPSPLATSVLPALLSTLVLAIVFWTLWPLDMPLVRFIRSLHNEWMESLGNLGNRLGSGWVLVGISGGILGVGVALKRTRWLQAGLESLIAHAAAGVLVQGLKHGIGRPRPRFAHSDQVLLAPSLESGLDSFPSGHAAASFAVAAVLARHFPRAAWVVYGLAAGVAMSRVVRGSHFPTDVLVGAILGFLLGIFVANPIHQWRKSLEYGLVRVTPFLVGIFAVLWTMTQGAPVTGSSSPLMFLGFALMAVGIGFRLRARLWPAGVLASFSPVDLPEAHTVSRNSRVGSVPWWANGAIGIGVAFTTGSLLITVLVGVVVLAQGLAVWRAGGPGTQEDSGSLDRAVRLSGAYGLVTELLVAGAWGLAVVLLQGLQGVLPLQ